MFSSQVVNMWFIMKLKHLTYKKLVNILLEVPIHGDHLCEKSSEDKYYESLYNDPLFVWADP